MTFALHLVTGVLLASYYWLDTPPLGGLVPLRGTPLRGSPWGGRDLFLGSTGSGRPCLYPAIVIPTHPLISLGFGACGKNNGDSFVCWYIGLTFWWCSVMWCFDGSSPRHSRTGCYCTLNFSLYHLFTALKISNFHRSGAVFLDGLARNAHCCCIVTMDEGGQLGMSHIPQG